MKSIFYSNKSRGMRKKAEAEQQADPPGPSEASSAPARRCSQIWAMLIKRVYEIDPMICPAIGHDILDFYVRELVTFGKGHREQPW
jgi:hypothetical protein